MEYPPCKKCGKSHGMGIEEMESGKITPIDLCYDCLWSNTTFNPITEKIVIEEDMKNILEDLEQRLLNENRIQRPYSN